MRRNAEFGVRRPPPGAAAGAGGVDDKTGVVFVLDILYGLYVKNVQPFRPFFNAPELFFVYVVCPNQPVVVQERAERQRFSACSGAIVNYFMMRLDAAQQGDKLRCFIHYFNFAVLIGHAVVEINPVFRAQADGRKRCR